jgi:hypothetical protein
MEITTPQINWSSIRSELLGPNYSVLNNHENIQSCLATMPRFQETLWKCLDRRVRFRSKFFFILKRWPIYSESRIKPVRRHWASNIQYFRSDETEISSHVRHWISHMAFKLILKQFSYFDISVWTLFLHYFALKRRRKAESERNLQMF